MSGSFDVIPWDAVGRLAASPSEQIAYLQSVNRRQSSVDERKALVLWSPIAEAWEKLLDLQRQGIVSRRELAKHPVFPIARQLDAMSDDDDLWSIEAVRYAPPWEVVRGLARTLLDAAGRSHA